MEVFFVHESSYIDEDVQIGKGTKIWHFCHVQSGARLGENCILGQNVNIANDVIIGNNCKIQNNVAVYTGTILEDDVFLGPSCVLTNVTNPRSQIKRHSLYEKILIRRGASVGANATLVCGITIGRYAFIAAGAVVTKDVPDYALIQGVPGKQVGWISRLGHKLLHKGKNVYQCPESGWLYSIEDNICKCLSWDEEAPLPSEMTVGTKYYDEIKTKFI